VRKPACLFCIVGWQFFNGCFGVKVKVCHFVFRGYVMLTRFICTVNLVGQYTINSSFLKKNVHMIRITLSSHDIKQRATTNDKSPVAGPLKFGLIYRVSQEERSIFWEVIVSVILSRKVYTYMCPVPNGFRDRATSSVYSSLYALRRATRRVLTRVAKCVVVGGKT
jgi:hypothetical protein